jgi:hypothetical protein
LGGFRGSNNNLTGPLDVLSSMAYMVSFAVDNNKLSGPVRVYLPNLKRLKYLNASNNHMSGSLLELGSPASTTPFVLALAGQDFYCPYPINVLSNSNTVLFDRSNFPKCSVDRVWNCIRNSTCWGNYLCIIAALSPTIYHPLVSQAASDSCLGFIGVYCYFQLYFHDRDACRRDDYKLVVL